MGSFHLLRKHPLVIATRSSCHLTRLPYHVTRCQGLPRVAKEILCSTTFFYLIVTEPLCCFMSMSSVVLLTVPWFKLYLLFSFSNSWTALIQLFQWFLSMSEIIFISQLQSLKRLYTLHFSIFPLEILNIASKLNLAPNYCLRFLNFNFGAILAKFSRKLGKSCKLRYGHVRFCAVFRGFVIKSTFIEKLFYNKQRTCKLILQNE